MSNLKDKYVNEVVPALKEKFSLTNPMTVPKITKVVLNMAFGILDKDAQKAAVSDLAKITGQRPAITHATKSISNFKLREGMPIGAKVTLRGERMYEFLERLIHATLPRIRDFRGIPAKAFDGRGNYSLGIREQLLFPEIEYDKVEKIRGMEIVFVTTAKTDEECKELLSLLGMPFEQA
jgi:large subunit ribosomal protein L5